MGKALICAARCSSAVPGDSVLSMSVVRQCPTCTETDTNLPWIDKKKSLNVIRRKIEFLLSKNHCMYLGKAEVPWCSLT